MPATVNYRPNSQPQPTLQKSNRIHKSGLHPHPHLPPRRILSKKILSGGSVSFRLGTLSSLYETSSLDIIEVPAEIISDYVAWEDLQAFEHDEFEKELAQKTNAKEEYEQPELTHMMGATVKRVKGRSKKDRDNFLRTTSPHRRKLTNLMEDLDTKSPKNQSIASSTEGHSENVKRNRRRSRKNQQIQGTIIRPGAKLENLIEDSEERSSDSQLYDSSDESHGGSNRYFHQRELLLSLRRTRLVVYGSV